jgi:hypothetical protein
MSQDSQVKSKISAAGHEKSKDELVKGKSRLDFGQSGIGTCRFDLSHDLLSTTTTTHQNLRILIKIYVF